MIDVIDVIVRRVVTLVVVLGLFGLVLLWVFYGYGLLVAILPDAPIWLIIGLVLLGIVLIGCTVFVLLAIVRKVIEWIEYG